ncbi:hypothetical protein CPC08DRAFT_347578 [Agrocybe pediades]|nr:hypothetical protein CPC08DRAFT_347578 [Agrocybe pediades]
MVVNGDLNTRMWISKSKNYTSFCWVTLFFSYLSAQGRTLLSQRVRNTSGPWIILCNQAVHSRGRDLSGSTITSPFVGDSCARKFINTWLEYHQTRRRLHDVSISLTISLFLPAYSMHDDDIPGPPYRCALVVRDKTKQIM